MKLNFNYKIFIRLISLIFIVCLFIIGFPAIASDTDLENIVNLNNYISYLLDQQLIKQEDVNNITKVVFKSLDSNKTNTVIPDTSLYIDINNDTHTLTFSTPKRSFMLYGEVFENFSNIEEIDFSRANIIFAPESADCFSGCSNLKKLDLSNCDGTKIEHANEMFLNCSSLIELNLNGFKTTNVTNMASMFENCHNLTNLNLSSFQTDNVVYSDSMFSGCYSLKELDLSNFRTQKNANMASMFKDCHSLTNLDLSSFQTDNVEYTAAMFQGCSSLKELNLSSFKMDKNQNMGSMFEDCRSLNKLNLSNFQLDRVEYIGDIFKGCSSLKEIITPSKLPSDTSITDFVYLPCYFSNLDSPKKYLVLSEIPLNTTLTIAHTELNIISEKTASCTEDGYKIGECSYCKTTFREALLSAGHTGENIVVKQATCTKDGLSQEVCKHCNKVLSESPIPALGHNDDQTWVEIKNSCEEDGEKYTSCTRCGEKLNHEILYKTEHKYNWIIDKSPSCSETGLQHQECIICHKRESENTVYSGCLEHEIGVSIINPTCTKEGSKSEFCKNCGTTISRTSIPATGHRIETYIIKESTCDEEGLAQEICTSCGEVVSENIIPANGHHLSTNVISPTCTKEGFSQEICDNCHKIISETIIPSIDHSCKTIIEIEPSCENKGKSVDLCTHCGEIIAVTDIPANGHIFEHKTIPATHLKNGKEYEECTICHHITQEKTIDSLPHEYIKIYIAPTEDSDGYYIYKCECGEEKKYKDEVIKDYVSGTKIKKSKHKEEVNNNQENKTESHEDNRQSQLETSSFNTAINISKAKNDPIIKIMSGIVKEIPINNIHYALTEEPRQPLYVSSKIEKTELMQPAEPIVENNVLSGYTASYKQNNTMPQNVSYVSIILWILLIILILIIFLKIKKRYNIFQY